jgi:uncharacterized repeat protein (TIGR01451 family)
MLRSSKSSSKSAGRGIYFSGVFMRTFTRALSSLAVLACSFTTMIAAAQSLPVIEQFKRSPAITKSMMQKASAVTPPKIGPARAPKAGALLNTGTYWSTEVEPNNTPATATPITGSNAAVRGNIFANGDVDYYSFTGTAGDRVYAAVVTSASANASGDSQLTLFGTDGTTILEFDDDNGSFSGLSSSIAGATLPANGTYYLKVNHFSATNQIRYYQLYLRVQSGAPTPEVEPNDTPATANPLPASGWVSGARSPAAATEQDWYSLTLNAGDTVFLSLDLDPERDGVVWNGRLGFGLFGDAGNQILVVDDAGAAEPPNPLRPSEAMVFTVKDAGTYFAFVDSATAATGGPTATYHLSVSVLPRPTRPGVCTTYTSTNVPQSIGPGAGLVSSTITIPGNPIIDHISVGITLNHTIMNQIDAHLRSPAGNDNGLFTDIGAGAAGGQTQMDVVFDDDAAIPPNFTVLKNMRLAPELAYRLGWFNGENAGGTWTLDLRDDTADANGGTLTGWFIEVCEPPPPPACATGFVKTTVFATDFEAGAAGFTHSGTGDQWALGLPNTAATTTANPIAGFTTCGSGTSCWKTNLTGTYGVSTSQDLLSPNINLAGLSAPVIVNWSHRYQMESASFDHYSVDFQQAGGATPVRVFEWLDATMTDAPGNPAVNIGASAGWAKVSARADSLAGLNTELKFHLDSDTTVNFGGVAIDDVSVTACRAASADLSITKTDGVTTATPGGSVTYTITASNATGDPVTGANVADTFPAACTSVTWSCVGAGGGTCTAAGSGNINDTIDLPTGASATYTATCNISASAVGTLSNTATISSAITDPTPGNNSATDTDTLVPQAELSITKTDGVTTATPGGSVTYTITASNAGPSDAPGSTVADTFPAVLTGTWTCVGAGGGTCTASGSGNINDTVNLPAGGSVTYTVSATISASATGTLSNTATVAAPGGVTDPTPGNNSATDTDTLVASANMSVTITDLPDPATAGSNVTYTITATNGGPSNAAGVTMNLPTPANTTFVSVTAPAGTSCTTPAVGGTGNVNCSVTGAMPPSSLVFSVVVQIAPSFSGSLPATATVASTTAEGAPGDESATANTAVGVLTFTVTGTASPPAGGTVNCTNPVAFGTTTTCSVSANAGYSIASISGCGAGPSTVSPFTTGSVTANCTVTATFIADIVVTGVVAGSGGSISCASPVVSGNTTSCIVTPNAGFTIASISGCGGVTSTTSPYTTGVITAACTVTATFAANIVVTGAVGGSGGSISCTSPVVSGNTTSCIVTPNAGFTIASISGCGGVAGTTSPYTTGVITAACTVTATFTALVAATPTIVPTMNGAMLATLALLLLMIGALGKRAWQRSGR